MNRRNAVKPLPFTNESFSEAFDDCVAGLFMALMSYLVATTIPVTTFTYLFLATTTGIYLIIFYRVTGWAISHIINALPEKC